MADTQTPNYNFIQPEIGASNNTWGQKTNDNWASLDSILKGISDNFANFYTETEVNTLLGSYYTKTEINALLADPWAFFPLGLAVPLNLGIVGFAAPPRNKTYKYIVLSAAEATTGKYNEGLIVSESVTGSSPNINATGVLNLAGSPFNGSTIPLINTSREYIRPGNPGVQEASQNLLHGHPITDAGHAHELNAIIGSSGSGGAFGQAAPAANEFPTGRGSARPSGTGIGIIGTGGDEARPRGRGANFYMRVL